MILFLKVSLGAVALSAWKSITQRTPFVGGVRCCQNFFPSAGLLNMFAQHVRPTHVSVIVSNYIEDQLWLQSSSLSNLLCETDPWFREHFNISTAGGSGEKFGVCACAVSLWNNRNKQTWRRPSTVLWSCKFIVIYLQSTRASIGVIDAALFFNVLVSNV